MINLFFSRRLFLETAKIQEQEFRSLVMFIVLTLQKQQCFENLTSQQLEEIIDRQIKAKRQVTLMGKFHNKLPFKILFVCFDQKNIFGLDQVIISIPSFNKNESFFETKTFNTSNTFIENIIEDLHLFLKEKYQQYLAWRKNNNKITKK